jgi:hypothetical protein
VAEALAGKGLFVYEVRSEEDWFAFAAGPAEKPMR